MKPPSRLANPTITPVGHVLSKWSRDPHRQGDLAVRVVSSGKAVKIESVGSNKL